MLTQATAHLNIHFEVGNLILVDALPSTFVFIDQTLSPYDLRLCACRNIINALNLAFQTNSPNSNEPPGFSILLLDPYPDLLTNAIIRTGSSLLLLYEMQKLCQENARTMFSVVIAALETLAKISHTAAEAIPLLKEKYASSFIAHQARSNPDATLRLEDFSLAAIDPEAFGAEVIDDLEQETTNPLFGESIHGKSDDGQDLPSFPDELAPDELESLSLDVDLQGTRLQTNTCCYPRLTMNRTAQPHFDRCIKRTAVRFPLIA